MQIRRSGFPARLAARRSQPYRKSAWKGRPTSPRLRPYPPAEPQNLSWLTVIEPDGKELQYQGPEVDWVAPQPEVHSVGFLLPKAREQIWRIKRIGHFRTQLKTEVMVYNSSYAVVRMRMSRRGPSTDRVQEVECCNNRF